MSSLGVNNINIKRAHYYHMTRVVDRITQKKT